MSNTTNNWWPTPKAEAIMTEAEFDRAVNAFNIFVAVAAAKTQSVAFEVVKTWLKKHL